MRPFIYFIRDRGFPFNYWTFFIKRLQAAHCFVVSPQDVSFISLHAIDIPWTGRTLRNSPVQNTSKEFADSANLEELILIFISSFGVMNERTGKNAIRLESKDPQY